MQRIWHGEIHGRGVSEQPLTPQILVFHTKPILGTDKAGLLAHCAPPPPALPWERKAARLQHERAQCLG